jgi:predicted nucleic acid-binding protein
MARTNGPSIAVCDAGPIIHLHELESLSLLADFQVWLTDHVVEEIRKHRPAALDVPALSFVQRPMVQQIPQVLKTRSTSQMLDMGELSALALMSRVPDSLFLTDDAAARLVAQELGYRVHGTVGILLRSIRRGRLSTLEVLEGAASNPACLYLVSAPVPVVGHHRSG